MTPTRRKCKDCGGIPDHNCGDAYSCGDCCGMRGYLVGYNWLYVKIKWFLYIRRARKIAATEAR